MKTRMLRAGTFSTGKGRTRFMLTVVAILAVPGSADAGTLGAGLTANPATINEGGTIVLSLTLTNTPHPRDTFIQGDYGDGGTTYLGYYASGAGQIDNASATINPGDGGASQGVSATVNSNSFSASRTLTYLNPGQYTATVNGTASLTDGRIYKFWKYNAFSGSWSVINSGNSSSNRTHSTTISASTSINVNNLVPSITSLYWDAVVDVGEDVNFTVNGFDPGGVAPTESMSFAYDFTGHGLYNDLIQSGSLSSSGTTNFDQAGVYTVGIQLSDGLGGVSLASFDVTVLAPLQVPEPNSLAMVSSLGVVGCVGRRRRRKEGACQGL